MHDNTEIIIGATYIPGQNSLYHDINIFDDLTNDILSLRCAHNAPIFMLGDFNARTLEKPDFIPNDPLLSDHDVEGQSIALPKRTNQDKVQANLNGNELLKICKALQVSIINGRVGVDSGVGKRTCFDRNKKGSSTNDYVLVSTEHFSKVKKSCCL